MPRSRCPNGSRKNKKSGECVRKRSGVVLHRGNSARKSLRSSASVGKVYNKPNSAFNKHMSSARKSAMKLPSKTSIMMNSAQKNFMTGFKGNFNLSNKTRRKR
jgi:hypothetical protein